MSEKLGFMSILLWFLIFSVPISLLNGWALSWLWYWFVVPFSLPALTIPHAIGLGLVTSFLTHSRSIKKHEETDIRRTTILALIYPPMIVGIGWIVQRYM